MNLCQVFDAVAAAFAAGDPRALEWSAFFAHDHLRDVHVDEVEAEIEKAAPTIAEYFANGFPLAKGIVIIGSSRMPLDLALLIPKLVCIAWRHIDVKSEFEHIANRNTPAEVKASWKLLEHMLENCADAPCPVDALLTTEADMAIPRYYGFLDEFAENGRLCVDAVQAQVGKCTDTSFTAVMTCMAGISLQKAVGVL